MVEVLKRKVDIITEDECYKLPDARDGLTPRQQRILWTLHVRKLSSSSKFEKTIYTFWDVVGK